MPVCSEDVARYISKIRENMFTNPFRGDIYEIEEYKKFTQMNKRERETHDFYRYVLQKHTETKRRLAMKQVTNNTKKQIKKLTGIQKRFQDLTTFIRTHPEDVIKTALYSDLLSDMDIFLNELLASIADAENHKAARELYGDTLNTLLVLRGEFKGELAVHDRTWRLTGSEKKRDRKYSPLDSHYYQIRTMKQEFGSAILSSGNEYMKWEEIPEATACRVSINQEIEQLLRQKSTISKSEAKREKMSAKLDSFVNEMNKRINDCRHILMITAMTDRDEKRGRKAFQYLYEAVTYRKKLLAAHDIMQQACKQMTL